MQLRGRRALITGATSGIGRAIALEFVAEGASVALTGRRTDRLDELVGTVAADGGTAVAVPTDHTRAEENARAIDGTVEALGGIDVLVNSAGVLGLDGLLEPQPAQWRRIMDINVDAVYDLTHRAVPHLVESPSASIINVSSVCSYRPFAGLLGYCVSKAAIDMFTRCLALELAPRGVRVNAINPGVVVTELHTVDGAIDDYDGFLERSKGTHPLGRVGQPEDIADLAAFLASDAAGWITGAIHPIDGGRGLTSLR